MKKCIVFLCLLLSFSLLTACGTAQVANEETAVQTTACAQSETTCAPFETTEAVTAAEPTTAAFSAVSASTTTTTTTAAPTTAATTAKPTATKPAVTGFTAIVQPTSARATTTKPTTTKPTTTTTTKPTTTTPTTTVPTVQNPTPVTPVKPVKKVCTVTVECKTIYDNLSKLQDNKKPFLPANGIILDRVQVELTGNESAFDVLKKACEQNVCTDRCRFCEAGGVQLEYTYTPAFHNYYIEGIHQIYEKDCGAQSGWMYCVNGKYPDVGASAYTVSAGDTIVFSFTCDMGEDIGNVK